MAKKNEGAAKQHEEVKGVTAGQWFKKNWLFVTALVVIVLGTGTYVLVKEYYVNPKQEAATNDLTAAYALFERGQYEAALEEYAAIADDYHNQEAKLASLYAGLCCYELKQYEEAAEYMEDFDADDLNIDPAVKMHVGDAYVEMGKLDKAVKAFKAAADSKNEFVAPMALKKAGIVYLEQGKNSAAKKVFEQIKNDYPASMEAADIEKYISFAE